MSVALVVAESEAVGMREAGDSAVVLETIGRVGRVGDAHAARDPVHAGPLATARRRPTHDELLYVVSG